MNELLLSYSDKIRLIEGIEYWQKRRWMRLRYFHSCEKLSLGARHLFMNKELALLRSQKQRLKLIKQSLLQ